ncbi:hypothetical protein [Neorhizobium sp. JUb45]|uniref:hypothetical protein n=1 Tax=unclassified Neorhizobium TaxID=2629175 RepID=UPI001048DA0C|nr:hypothetical protein [Neorhizobium sp. JUb45]TCR02043.1 hypothetical protein EDF70_104320 [Neorhizobium sp. JUb45]
MIIIHNIERSDGKARVEFVQHGNGLYSFNEEQELEDEVPGLGPHTYWAPTHVSGIYDEMAAAVRDAKAALRWLRDAGAL